LSFLFVVFLSKFQLAYRLSQQLMASHTFTAYTSKSACISVEFLCIRFAWDPITNRSFPREAFPRDDAQGTFPRAAIRARKRTLMHHRAETLRAEKIGALLDPALRF